MTIGLMILVNDDITDGWIFVDHALVAVSVLSHFVSVGDKRLFSIKTLPPPVS